MKLHMLGGALVALLLSLGQASAWGPNGHKVVGSIADQLLKPNAKSRVETILGFTLRVAAPWADCVKSVKPQTDGSFKYIREPLYAAPCKPFEAAQSAAEQARMEDYVTRNWNACSYQNHHKGCEDTYHFADVPIQRDDYSRDYPGTNSHDIVTVINAAIGVLQGQPSPDPIKIRDQKEALFLLAHLMGDLHQPLHVGSVYLKGNRRFDPPNGSPPPDETETAGGNFIHDGSKALHSKWDAIPSSLGDSANTTLVNQAKAVPATTGTIDTFAAKWASETIVVAQGAFTGMRFTKIADHNWNAKLPANYWTKQNQLKRKQLAKAGARLAQLLNSIWP